MCSVVKLGGSLQHDALLPAWLELLASRGGRVVVVPGGGRFADAARAAQAHWQFSDLAAHDMAVLGMAQMATLMHGLAPALALAESEPRLVELLARGEPALWRPLDLLRAEADDSTHWGVTSDSLALALAVRLRAARLLVVKSCTLEPGRTLDELSEAGVLDAEFAARARAAPGLAIDVLHKSELPRAKALLRQAPRAEPGVNATPAPRG